MDAIPFTSEILQDIFRVVLTNIFLNYVMKYANSVRINNLELSVSVMCVIE